MNTTPHILARITEHFAKGDNRRVVFATQMGGSRSIVLAPADLPKLKADGRGLRYGKLYIFDSQVRFARVA